MEIINVIEFQGCQVLGYMCKGHVTFKDFEKELLAEYSVTCDVEQIKHEYWRNVPQGEEGMIMIKSVQGKGAYKVTWIDVDYCRKSNTVDVFDPK